MSNTVATRPVIRASVIDIARLAEFLSVLLDAPVMITSASDEVPVPAERHLVLIVAESPPPPCNG
ncbi:hypothetical protein D2E70_16130 [Mycobacteroides abscessus]|uniref:hypothetical protein n=1 Tax=Mycobacteroides abscessus TaxID=36809 RepID=UPI000E68B968|nr:hypothetical protein [Mycobacteroides abscessus]RIS68886.1 hypothetical protein D2E70_16130 [Mycobacteroides abscessus]